MKHRPLPRKPLSSPEELSSRHCYSNPTYRHFHHYPFFLSSDAPPASLLLRLQLLHKCQEIFIQLWDEGDSKAIPLEVGRSPQTCRLQHSSAEPGVVASLLSDGITSSKCVD
ncbi:unnamed protein product [Caretta caretta]